MSTFSESSILTLLSKYFPNQHNSLLLGRGDDCAVLREQNALCISTDIFLEDIHFRTSYFTPQEVGHKALAVNISDLAAMGVRPLGFSLGLAIPAHIELTWLEAFFSGMASLAKTHNMVLSGGDISRSEKIFISITAWGEGITLKQLNHSATPENTQSPPNSPNTESTGIYLTRGGAMPGDALFLVGNVGLARIGLEELEKNGREALKHWPQACATHLLPQPMVDAGLILARSSSHNMRPPVLMDLSDGLARDIPRLLGIDKQNMLGAKLIFPKALLHEEVLRHAKLHGRDATKEAWLGGEDYALLGACVPKLLPILHAALPHLHSIGTITDSGKIELNEEILMPDSGFDHFS